MENIYPFKDGEKWYKGNLHCHSTISDGRLSPEEVVKIYKNNGWNFLAFTEHETYSDYKGKYNGDSFITIPGIEASNNNFKDCNYNHFLGISSTGSSYFKNGQEVEPEKWTGYESMQKTIDILNENNSMAVICHPDWSRSNFDILNRLTGYTAVEIFNYGCRLESNSGLSTVYWDYLLRQGKKVWGVATDDAHHILKDECGGFIMVKADELTPDKIIEAIKKGSFYSSSGPEIYDFYIEDGYVHLECSNVKHIHVIAFGHLTWGMSYNAEAGKYVNSVKYKLNGYEQYIRIECEDESGNIAWSNPIFLKAKKHEF